MKSFLTILDFEITDQINIKDIGSKSALRPASKLIIFSLKILKKLSGNTGFEISRVWRKKILIFSKLSRSAEEDMEGCLLGYTSKPEDLRLNAPLGRMNYVRLLQMMNETN